MRELGVSCLTNTFSRALHCRQQRLANEYAESVRQKKHRHSSTFTSQGLRRRRRRDFLGYYRALGFSDLDADEDGKVLPQEASTEDIKAAFKRMALKFHPDKQLGKEEAEKDAAQKQFVKAQAAYDVLKDPKKRKEYDKGRLLV